MAMRARTKKGYLKAAWCFGGAVVICLVSLIVFFTVLLPGGDDSHSFLIPGEIVVNVDEPGEYLIWAVQNGRHEGQMYAGSATLPDNARSTVIRVDDGTPVPMLASQRHMSVSSGTRTSTIAARVEIDIPGEYAVSVQGDFPPRVALFEESGLVALSLPIMMLYVVLGLLALCLGFAGIKIFLSTFDAHMRTPHPTG